MFGKNDHTAIKSLIAQGTRVEGDMTFADGLRVDGEVLGAIHGKPDGSSMLVISEGAVVQGGVKADHVIINGTVNGPVEAREVLELQSRASIEGDVQYAALEMQQGATTLGQQRPLATATGSLREDKPLTRLAAKAG